ncbi:MAG: signal peptidase II [Candidatus Dormibacteraeota bacterium]|nr:signal peptidase II [Candidatus Dormibacteraeota bacterium]
MQLPTGAPAAWKPAAAAAAIILLGDLLGRAVMTASRPAHQRTWLWAGRLGLEWVPHVRPWHVADFGALGLALLPLGLLLVRSSGAPSRGRQVLGCVAGAAAGGAVANSVERMAHGYVTDWLLVTLGGRDYLPNLADLAITGGIVAVGVAFVAFVLSDGTVVARPGGAVRGAGGATTAPGGYGQRSASGGALPAL